MVLSVGLFTAAACFAVDAPVGIKPLVSGTVHDALFSIAFDQDAGIAVGAAGAIFNTADGGKTWKAVTPAPTPLSLLGADIKASRQIVVGQTGLVLVNEAAAGWKKMESGTSERLFAVSANAAGVAVTVGSFGVVLKSEDGGHSWKSVAPDWSAYTEDGAQPHLYAAQVDDAGVMTIAGEFGLILRSSNGGIDWRPLHKGDASIFALELRPDGVGYAVGQSGTVLHTVDGGATWQMVDVKTQAILLGVHSSADGQVVLTGMRDMLLSTDAGLTWRHVVSEEITTSWFGGVAQAAAGSPILAVGQAGRIIRVGG